MYASKIDKSTVPHLTTEINNKRLPYFEASGFADVLGILGEAKLLISTSKYELSIAGKFLNFFDAELIISASYRNVSKANFIVEGSFKNDLFASIVGMIREGIEMSSKEAGIHISEAKAKIKNKTATLKF